MEARRLQAAQLFARGVSQAAVARQLGVTTAAVNHWHQAWRAKGRTGLKAAGRAGRKPQLGPNELRQVERALRAGFHHYVTKPVEPNALILAVAKAVGRGRNVTREE